MIDTKEKLKHCLNIERKIYFPRGGDKDSFRPQRERHFIWICI